MYSQNGDGVIIAKNAKKISDSGVSGENCQSKSFLNRLKTKVKLLISLLPLTMYLFTHVFRNPCFFAIFGVIDY